MLPVPKPLQLDRDRSDVLADVSVVDLFRTLLSATPQNSRRPLAASFDSCGTGLRLSNRRLTAHSCKRAETEPPFPSPQPPHASALSLKRCSRGVAVARGVVRGGDLGGLGSLTRGVLAPGVEISTVRAIVPNLMDKS